MTEFDLPDEPVTDGHTPTELLPEEGKKRRAEKIRKLKERLAAKRTRKALNQHAQDGRRPLAPDILACADPAPTVRPPTRSRPARTKRVPLPPVYDETYWKGVEWLDGL